MTEPQHIGMNSQKSALQHQHIVGYTDYRFARHPRMAATLSDRTFGKGLLRVLGQTTLRRPVFVLNKAWDFLADTVGMLTTNTEVGKKFGHHSLDIVEAARFSPPLFCGRMIPPSPKGSMS